MSDGRNPRAMASTVCPLNGHGRKFICFRTVPYFHVAFDSWQHGIHGSYPSLSRTARVRRRYRTPRNLRQR